MWRCCRSAGLNSAASRWGSRALRARIGRPLPHHAALLRVDTIVGLTMGNDCPRPQPPPPLRPTSLMTTIAMGTRTPRGVTLLAAITMAPTLAATASIVTPPRSTRSRRSFRATMATGAGETILTVEPAYPLAASRSAGKSFVGAPSRRAHPSLAAPRPTDLARPTRCKTAACNGRLVNFDLPWDRSAVDVACDADLGYLRRR